MPAEETYNAALELWTRMLVVLAPARALCRKPLHKFDPLEDWKRRLIGYDQMLKHIAQNAIAMKEKMAGSEEFADLIVSTCTEYRHRIELQIGRINFGIEGLTNHA